METPEDKEVFIKIAWPDQMAAHHILSIQVFSAWALHVGETSVNEYLQPFGYSMRDVADLAKEVSGFTIGGETAYSFAEYQRMVFATAFTGVFVLTSLGETLLQKAFEEMPNWLETLGSLNFRQQFLMAHSAIIAVERGDAPNNPGMVAFFEKVDAFLDLEQMEREFGG